MVNPICNFSRTFIMPNRLTSRALITAAFVSAIAALAPSVAVAREGAQSVGGGVKCLAATSVKQADGSFKISQVCYKSI
jgi:uncharacterized membrane protein